MGPRLLPLSLFVCATESIPSGRRGFRRRMRCAPPAPAFLFFFLPLQPFTHTEGGKRHIWRAGRSDSCAFRRCFPPILPPFLFYERLQKERLRGHRFALPVCRMLFHQRRLVAGSRHWVRFHALFSPPFPPLFPPPFSPARRVTEYMYGVRSYLDAEFARRSSRLSFGCLPFFLFFSSPLFLPFKKGKEWGGPKRPPPLFVSIPFSFPPFPFFSENFEGVDGEAGKVADCGAGRDLCRFSSSFLVFFFSFLSWKGKWTVEA